MASFGFKDFVNDFGCKLVFSVHRMRRDVSIGTTCLLSVFQAIAISPLNSKWAELKVKAPKYIGTSKIFCWILNRMLNIIFPLHMTDKRNKGNFIQKRDYGYCYKLHVALLLCRDGFFLVVMVWATGFMVSILHRHKQQLHKVSLSWCAPFLSLWILSIFLICLAIFNHLSFWMWVEVHRFDSHPPDCC
ncbi:hypothetical protein HPG69_013964 [Diceros bicornis minor]|uniref:Vomeronasal type-1 receptor n=1 Tax=Diceros bicornis minor TaxID=77932 RepID=A0A7J7EML2_DICBM|nr:hypothetical protein HPG69_013964 [Diceros bicornis minor]